MLGLKEDLKSSNSLEIKKGLKRAVTLFTPQFEKQKENAENYSYKAPKS
jgi:hypothetical protein